MIPFRLKDEPPTFDTECRQAGKKWISENLVYDRPKDLWSPFERDLRLAFDSMCGWCAMFIMKGQVDHFVPVATLKKTGQDELAYDWKNFRYIEGWINQKKLNAAVLDPFVVEAGWFEIILPSLQLEPTDKIPPAYKDLAVFTLKRLGLRDHEVVLQYRERWFNEYRNNGLTLASLRSFAPLIADAVERDLNAGKDWRYKK